MSQYKKLVFLHHPLLQMPRPILCTIDSSAIRHNIQVIKNLNPAAHCMAVVKANAYGHHINHVFQGLGAADSLALLEIENARQLRDLGWSKPITLLEGCFEQADIEQAMLLGCDWVIHSLGQLSQLELNSTLLRQTGHKPLIYLKVNTGMNRLGLALGQVESAVARLNHLVEKYDLPAPVLMTHFANADVSLEDKPPITPQEQYDFLHSVLPQGWRVSLANSAGALNWPSLAGQVIRPGISIYGATPGPKTAREYGLLPAMALTSEVISIQHLNPGDFVGYGSRYQANSVQTIAVVACGYADGYPRHAPDGTPVWIAGKICPLAGKVSMDMLTVDVTSHGAVQIGDSVELWGSYLPVDVVAEASGTIGYELLCAVAPRVPFESKDLCGDEV